MLQRKRLKQIQVMQIQIHVMQIQNTDTYGLIQIQISMDCFEESLRGVDVHFLLLLVSIFSDFVKKM